MITLIRPDGEELTLQASPGQSIEQRVSVTDHPVEDGLSVSDHVQEQQDRLSITAVFTDSPFVIEGESAPNSRIDEVLRFLNGAGRAGELLEVETRLGISGNWLLEEWPHDITHLRGLSFHLALRQIRIAGVQVVMLPRIEVIYTMTPEEDLGLQPTEEISGADEVEDRSFLDRLVDLLPGRGSK